MNVRLCWLQCTRNNSEEFDYIYTRGSENTRMYFRKRKENPLIYFPKGTEGTPRYISRLAAFHSPTGEVENFGLFSLILPSQRTKFSTSPLGAWKNLIFSPISLYSPAGKRIVILNFCRGTDNAPAFSPGVRGTKFFSYFFTWMFNLLHSICGTTNLWQEEIPNCHHFARPEISGIRNWPMK